MSRLHCKQSKTLPERNDYNVIDAYQIPHAVIGNYTRFSQHTNANLMRLKSPILLDERIVDIKEKMILNIKKSHNKLSLSS